MQYLLSWLIVLDKFYTWLAQGRTNKAHLPSEKWCFEAGFHLNSTLNVHLNIKEKCTPKYAFSKKHLFII